MAETATPDLGTPPAGPAPEANGAATFTTTAAPDWREALPSDLKLDKQVMDFKSVADLARGFSETRKFVSEGVRIPKPDAKPEEIATFHKRLGVPETPDKYQIELPKLPEGAGAWHEPTIQGFRETAHKAGLTPAQVTQLIGWYAQDQLSKRDQATSTQGKATTEARAAAEKALEETWGPKNSPTWKRNVGLARATVRHFFADDPAMADLAEMRGNDPAWVKGLAKIGMQMLEDGYIEGEAVDVPDKSTLDAQITEARRVLAGMNAGSRGYVDAKAHMDRLYQMRYAAGK
jgi:hypothetical protein